jgi:hypothetical protein
VSGWLYASAALPAEYDGAVPIAWEAEWASEVVWKFERRETFLISSEIRVIVYFMSSP